MLIQITTITGELVSTVPVDVGTPMVLVLRPCFYCDRELVPIPKKFCCDAHKQAYWRKFGSCQ